MQTSAQTWDSYKAVMLPLLEALKPKHCFEWGAGESTKLLCGLDYVDTVDSVEHSSTWIGRVPRHDKLNLIYEPNIEFYPYVNGRHDYYDLIFVDGKDRVKCLRNAMDRVKYNGVVILHDAERAEYQDAIELFPYRVWGDEGHTVVMFKNPDLRKIVR